MPNRDYYLNKGEKFDAYRAAYKTYVTKILELVGDKDPASSAAKVIALEGRIAAVAWSPERQRNVQEAVNPMDRAGLKKLVANVDWDTLLTDAGLGDAKVFVVSETTAIRDGAKLLDSQPIDAWKAYLAFHVANNSASDLTRAFDEASFAFYSKTLRGIEKQRDRWKRGIQVVDQAIGEGLGELYVARHFPARNEGQDG